MNERGRDVLRQAALDGVKQCKGGYMKFDHGPSYCALGIFVRKHPSVMPGCEDWDRLMRYYGIAPYETGTVTCEICGETSMGEEGLIVHLNDEHDLDFLAIANKV